MKIKTLGNGAALVELTSAEIITISNALNEVCNGIQLEGEFDTRIGCTVEDARSLLAEINRLGNSLNKSN
jgi:hypothetical protein